MSILQYVTPEPSELELVLQNIPLHSDRSSFTGTVMEPTQKVNWPSYIIPLKREHGEQYALLHLNNRLVKARIGFVFETESKEKYFTSPDHTGRPKPESWRGDTVYLPLQITDLYQALKLNGELMEGSPFKVLGITGKHGTYPFKIITEHLPNQTWHLTATNKIGSYYTGDKPDETEKITIFKSFQREEKEVTPVEMEKQPVLQEVEIKAYLDQHIIGQERAKQIAVTAVSNYIAQIKSGNKTRFPKPNVLMIGPTGSGKTEIWRALAEMPGLEVPLIETKLVGKSTSGYVGENLGRIWTEVRRKTVGQHPYCIVFFDEVDKLADENRGVFQTWLQDELIGYLDGALVMGSQRVQQASLSTKNMLFILAGAFHGSAGNKVHKLEDIIKKRKGIETERPIGFRLTKQNKSEVSLHDVTQADLIAYGLKQELVGRLPAIAVLDELSTEDKTRILEEAEHSILQQYQNLLLYKGFDTEIKKEAVVAIANACDKESGARALESICHKVFFDITAKPEAYTNEEGKIIIDKKRVEERLT